MKYAIISDLHANLEALEAVLADMRPHADTVICLGAIVGWFLERWLRRFGEGTVCVGTA